MSKSTESHSLTEGLAAELRAELARRQLTYAELARRTDIGVGYVGIRMRGESPWTLEDLERVAHVLDLPLTTLIAMGERAASLAKAS